MKPPPFRYVRPATLDEALEYLVQHGDEPKVFAGGQSVVPLMNFPLARPADVERRDHRDPADSCGRSAVDPGTQGKARVGDDLGIPDSSSDGAGRCSRCEEKAGL